ncbi:MAG: class I SAM-dependent methyltransferase [Planctomycetota bacterium JB042]
MREVVREEYGRRARDHWWFRARRRIFARLLDRQVPLREGARIVDVGPGYGVNAEILAPRGRLAALDLDPASLRACDGATPVRADAVRPPLRPGSIDLLCALDVLEHLDDDAEALLAWRQALRPDGRLLLSVPAFPALWGRQDVLSEHRRRYRRAPLEALLRAAGFDVLRSTYFNTLLFPPIALMRIGMRPFLSRSVRDGGSDLEVSLPFGLDRIPYALFAAEASWLARRDLPFGVSLLALAAPGARA